MRNLVWASSPELLIERSLGQDLGTESAHLYAHIDLEGRGPVARLLDLQHAQLRVFVSQPLADKLAHVGLLANDYVLIQVDASYLEAAPHRPFCTWPEPLSPAEVDLPWVYLGPRGQRSMMARFGGLWNPWDLSFRHATPELLPAREGLKLKPGEYLIP
jgi:hypothetical protein